MKMVFRTIPPDPYFDAVRAICPQVEIVSCPADEGLADHLTDVEVIFGGFSSTPQMIRDAPRLRWAHTVAAGVENYVNPQFAAQGVVLTNGRGVHLANLAEHALAMMLAFARGLPTLVRAQERALWVSGEAKPKAFVLEGQRLGILGYGEIGSAITVRAKAFGMEVWAMRRRAGGLHLADRMFVDDLPALLEGVDHLMLTLPLTDSTRGLIDAAALSRMKSGAYLYNLGRGALVDQPALIAALQSGRLAGAGLDVTTPEPLPADSPLWAMTNVLITSHTAGDTGDFWPKTMAFFLDNLRRYAAGQPLANVVDTDAGY